MSPETGITTCLSCAVCGYKNGGTTFVAQLIEADPQISGRFEIGILLADTPAEIPQIRPEVLANLRRFWRIDDDVISDMSKCATFAEAYRVLMAAARLAGPLIFDKFPDYVFEIDRLARRYDVPFVVVLRRPEPLLYSRVWRVFKKNKAPLQQGDRLALADIPFPLEGFVREYRLIAERVSAAQSALRNVRSFWLEDFVHDLDGTRAELFDFIGRAVPEEDFGDIGVSREKLRPGIDRSVLDAHETLFDAEVVDQIREMTRV